MKRKVVLARPGLDVPTDARTPQQVRHGSVQGQPVDRVGRVRIGVMDGRPRPDPRRQLRRSGEAEVRRVLTTVEF